MDREQLYRISEYVKIISARYNLEIESINTMLSDFIRWNQLSHPADYSDFMLALARIEITIGYVQEGAIIP